MNVPVTYKGKPQMPTTPSRARKWIKYGKATPYWNRGVFCVRLNEEPSGHYRQSIALGIDPGSKREGFTLKSENTTYLNIQAHAVTWVKDHVESRRNARKRRRSSLRHRKPRFSNRRSKRLAPSTKARWQWKLRVLRWLSQMYPIETVVCEDIAAHTKPGKGRWNTSFSPLQVGKKWFYGEIIKNGYALHTPAGYETARLRDEHGLHKSKNKLSNEWHAHCVDSWVLANWWTGGHTKPDNTEVLEVIPLQLHRRQLHRFQPGKTGLRPNYGGTRSLGFKRGSIVVHKRWGETYVGGSSNGRISLHSLSTGKRLTRSANPQDLNPKAFASFRVVSSNP